jgi:hypothetical protein
MCNAPDELDSISLIPQAISADFLQLCDESSSHFERIQSAMRRIGILSDNELLVTYVDNSAWKLGGAETYISDFLITCNSYGANRSYHVIAKAIFKWGLNIDQVIQEWIDRQQRLDAFKVPTPRLFGYCRGILFQQFISFRFQDYFRCAQHTEKIRLGTKLLNLAYKIDKAGFYPRGLVEDLRTDGEELFVIDLGEDLGHFVPERSGRTAINLALDWLRNRSGLIPFEVDNISLEKSNVL